MNSNLIDLIKSYAKQIEVDFNLIWQIYIIVYNNVNEYLGKAQPININNKLYCNILLHQSIIEGLTSDDIEKLNLSKNVILHELYHCKEIAITSSFLNWEKLYFHQTTDTTKLLLMDIAYNQWSEYYAYFHSSKMNHRDIKLSKYLSCVNSSLEALHIILIENPNMNDIQIPYYFIDNITDFIHTCVMLAAHYNATYDDKYIKVLKYIQRSSTYGKYYSYLKDIICYMDDLYNTYPQWVSELSFMELGRKLLSFIKIHSLTFSTDDLSDNFLVKIDA